MKYRMSISVLILAASLLLAAPVRAEDEPPPPKKPKLDYLYVAVSGAETAQIVAAAQKRVWAVPGVESFAWTAAHSEAKIIRVAGRASTTTLVAAFKAVQPVV